MPRRCLHVHRHHGHYQGLVHGLDDDQTERALVDLRRLLDEHATADGVLLGSSAWLVIAPSRDNRVGDPSSTERALEQT